MNNLSSSLFQWKENVDEKFPIERKRTRTIRNFSAFSLIVPSQCKLKFSLLHWKSHSAAKIYYNSWISDKLKVEMDKVSGPNGGPTSLRYFQWEICVFSRRKIKKFARALTKRKFSLLETFYRRPEHGREFSLWKIFFQGYREQKSVSNCRRLIKKVLSS